jgi:hypothetical protein
MTGVAEWVPQRLKPAELLEAAGTRMMAEGSFDYACGFVRRIRRLRMTRIA